MIISSLTLENFRVFKGKHRIDLETKKDLPIVLFGGLNGAGKTTILTAVKLVLFGVPFGCHCSQSEARVGALQASHCR